MSESVPPANVRLKRAYAAASTDDGTRILVDRLWPRGVSKERAALDDWLKDIAPTTALREWFGHDPAKWVEFQERYRVELTTHHAEVDRLRQIALAGSLTLVYAAKDTVHNDAVVLRDVLLHG